MFSGEMAKEIASESVQKVHTENAILRTNLNREAGQADSVGSRDTQWGTNAFNELLQVLKLYEAECVDVVELPYFIECVELVLM